MALAGRPAGMALAALAFLGLRQSGRGWAVAILTLSLLVTGLAAWGYFGRLPTDEVTRRVRELAVQAFRAVDCAGLARVDFFIEGETNVLVNEINTLPGFTAQSLVPSIFFPQEVLRAWDIPNKAAMQAAIGAVPYASSVKVGLQFKRRFWEEDEQRTRAPARHHCRRSRLPVADSR